MTETAEPFPTDEDLFQYALIHSQTERALFHRDHVRRLLELAGRVPKTIDSFPDFVKSIVDDAREKLKQKEPAAP